MDLLSNFIYHESGVMPIRALAFSTNNPYLLYFCSNGTLTAYNIESKVYHSFIVFNSHAIHGMKEVFEKILVFGDKSLCVITSCDYKDFSVLTRLQQLDDLVLDCQIIVPLNILVIAFAHNFIDLYDISNQSVPKNLSRIQCGFICVLFSISLSPLLNDEMIIASGTAFGKIILWKVQITKETLLQKTTRVNIFQVISGHEGVIFRTEWSKNLDCIATVSDDRTVRVFDVTDGSERFVGWGHRARIWDVVFVDETKIATASEDGCVIIWDFVTKCQLVTLRGHSSDVWRVAVGHNHLLTGGNDGSVKCWDLAYAGSQASSRMTLSVPSQSGRREGQNRRSGGVCFVSISPQATYITVVLSVGDVWLLDLGAAGGAAAWELLTALGKPVGAADVLFASDFDSLFRGRRSASGGLPLPTGAETEAAGETMLQVLCAHSDGSVSLYAILGGDHLATDTRLSVRTER